MRALAHLVRVAEAVTRGVGGAASWLVLVTVLVCAAVAVLRYGFGFWLHPTSDAVVLIGADAGVSFRAVHDRAAGVTHTVLANTTDGAWPVARLLQELLTP